MVGVSLTMMEKKSIPDLHLKNDIKTLNDAIKNSHNKIKQIEREEKKKVIEVILEKKKNVESFKKSFNELVKPKARFKPIEQKESNKECNTRELGRIMSYFKDVNINNDWVFKKIIFESVMLHNNILITGLNFLVRWGFVEEKKDVKGFYLYRLKEVKE
jgi:hypothetical protein